MRIRDKEIFVLSVAAFALVFILICSGYSAVSGWFFQYKNNKTGYQYSEEYYVHSTNSYMASYMDYEALEEDGYYEDDMALQEECYTLCGDDTDTLVSVMSKQDNTIYISDIWLNVGESNQYREMSIVMSYEDTWYADLAEGEYPSENDTGVCVAIGENLLADTVTKNGKTYIWLADTYVEVTGVFENYKASGEDYSVVVFGGAKFVNESEKCKTRIQEFMDDDELVIVMGSDRPLVSDTKFENDIAEADNLYIGETGYFLSRDMSRQESSLSNNLWDYMYNIRFMVICIMVLFGICNSVALSRVYVARRRKDFMIMRTYGMENKKIMGLVIKEQLMMAGTGLVIAAVVSSIYISISGGWHTSDYMVLWFVLTLCIGLLLVLICCTLSIYTYIRKLVPANAVKTI